MESRSAGSAPLAIFRRRGAREIKFFGRGTWKARLVKQGFREDKATADGPDFNYFAHVGSFSPFAAPSSAPTVGLVELQSRMSPLHFYKVSSTTGS